MKNIIHILAILAGITLFWSCQEDEKVVLQQPESFVLNTPKYASAIYDLKNTESIEFTTSQPDYGFTAAAIYSVQVALTSDFTNPVTLPGSYTTAKFAINAADLALALVGMHGVTLEEDYPTDPHPLYVRLISKLNAKNAGEVFSNVITLPQVKGYFALDPMVMPEEMFIIGNVAGNWSWDGATAMVPVWGSPGKFWAMQYLGQTGDGGNAEIKFNFAKAWDGNEFGYGQATVNANGTADPGASDSGGNIGIGNPGWYIVVVTTAINGRDYEFAVDFYPPHLHLQGNVASGNWGTTDEAYRFTVPALSLGADAAFVSPPFTNTGEIRASIQLPGHEWWHTEFIVLDGVFAPRGAGDDQERVTGNAGQKLHINFTTNTGKVE
ncbi:SusF/SusE family outer membrane protein [Dysgonomonadaceae bacterium zrk40]|nr:SusF/SusE family outer membrane protein [Dysgonomonadaceae bacterium zrk40]